MKELFRLNYLYYGDALECLAKADLRSFRPFVNKRRLIESIEKRFTSDGFLRAVVEQQSGNRAQRVDVRRLLLDIKQSQQMNGSFNALGCRGFSYKLFTDMTGFPYRLRRNINLRMALVADSELFYPKKVRDYIVRHRANHYFAYQAPAIAFAQGIANKDAWYIFVLQSDLVRYGPTAVRQHFRGWRKVLFANIVEQAKPQVERVYLCQVDDVVSACHSDFPKPTPVPPSWDVIYHGTALDFGMRLNELPRGINIQLYDRKPAVYARRMYELKLARVKTGFVTIRNERRA